MFTGPRLPASASGRCGCTRPPPGSTRSEIARALRRKNVEGAFLCGLLHDVGKPLVMQELIQLASERTERPVPNAILVRRDGRVPRRGRQPDDRPLEARRLDGGGDPAPPRPRRVRDARGRGAHHLPGRPPRPLGPRGGGGGGGLPRRARRGPGARDLRGRTSWSCSASVVGSSRSRRPSFDRRGTGALRRRRRGRRTVRADRRGPGGPGRQAHPPGRRERARGRRVRPPRHDPVEDAARDGESHPPRCAGTTSPGTSSPPGPRSGA